MASLTRYVPDPLGIYNELKDKGECRDAMMMTFPINVRRIADGLTPSGASNTSLDVRASLHPPLFIRVCLNTNDSV